ncbi:MAG: TIGR01777 family oxidoreductase [Salinivirgaceae bacterium]|nr:TIGR01777 family oxidoreductase [Salinivirgaceae bacterium]
MIKQQGYILIYGATGLVGQELVPFLIEKGHKVAVLARNVTKAKQLFGTAIIILSTEGNYQNICSDTDFHYKAIINLAGANVGSKSWTKEYKNEIVKSRVQSIEVLKACVDQMVVKPKVWVQASAVGYYGANVINETDELGKKGEGFLANVVSIWEETLDIYNLPVMRKVFLRLGIVMTKKGGFLKQMLNVSNLGVVALPYVENQKLAWIHIHDLINVIQESISNINYTGKVNVVSPKPASLDEMKNQLLKNSRAFFKIRVPKFIFNLVIGSVKTKEMILANQNIVSNVLINNNFNYQFENLNSVFESDL